MPDDFRILFVADVVGQPGREAVKAILPGLKRELDADLPARHSQAAALANPLARGKEKAPSKIGRGL